MILSNQTLWEKYLTNIALQLGTKKYNKLALNHLTPQSFPKTVLIHKLQLVSDIKNEHKLSSTIINVSIFRRMDYYSKVIKEMKKKHD